MQFIRILILALTCFFLAANVSPQLTSDTYQSFDGHIFELSEVSSSDAPDTLPGGGDDSLPSPVNLNTPFVAVLHKVEIEITVDEVNDPAVEADNDNLSRLRRTDRCSSAASVA